MGITKDQSSHGRSASAFTKSKPSANRYTKSAYLKMSFGSFEESNDNR